MNWKRTDLLYGASSWPTRKNWLEKQAQKEAWGESALWWTWPKVMTGFQGSNSVISVGLCFSTTFFTTRLPLIQGIHLTPWSWQIPTLTKSFLSRVSWGRYWGSYFLPSHSTSQLLLFLAQSLPDVWSRDQIYKHPNIWEHFLLHSDPLQA